MRVRLCPGCPGPLWHNFIGACILLASVEVMCRIVFHDLCLWLRRQQQCLRPGIVSRGLKDNPSAGTNTHAQTQTHASTTGILSLIYSNTTGRSRVRHWLNKLHGCSISTATSRWHTTLKHFFRRIKQHTRYFTRYYVCVPLNTMTRFPRF